MADAKIPSRALPGGQMANAVGRVRVHTLTNLRWMATAGQTIAIFVIYFGFGYTLPLLRCLIAVAALAGLNLFLVLRYLPNHRLSGRETTVYLTFDVLQLAVLLYLTGGISNPFAMMFIAPVVIAAATLDLANALIVGGIALLAGTLIAVTHEPLPWVASGMPFTLPPLYQAGLWASLVLSLGFTSSYVWRVASDGTRMSAGLAASQLALAREQRLSSLGALATAAAHELGTPLGTIAVVSHELERALPPGSSEADDAALLREQAERCRQIIKRLAQPEAEMVGQTETLPICALLDDLADSYRDGIGVDITIVAAPANRNENQPIVWRAPELMHGIGNLIENATDFATTKVTVEAGWNARELRIAVCDDGPGFAPDIFERIGEPYTTSRPGYHALGEGEMATAAEAGKHEGMGLGFFIAKTLLEQTGGTVRASNPAEGGARVTIIWPRGAIDGETSPSHLSKD